MPSPDLDNPVAISVYSYYSELKIPDSKME